jgi:hypothetical protein
MEVKVMFHSSAEPSRRRELVGTLMEQSLRTAGTLVVAVLLFAGLCVALLLLQ